MKSVFVVAVAIALTACGYPEYRQADNKVLCDPKLQQAYLVQPGMGAVSYLHRNPNLDEVCKN